MTTNCSRIALFIFLSSFLVLYLPTLHAASYVFSQRGFPNGGFVTGSFSGQDKYGADGGLVNIPPYGPDGIINYCSGRGCPFFELNEVSAFSIHFGGNSTFESLNGDPEAGMRWLTYDIKHNQLALDYGTCDTACFPYWNYNGGSGSLIYSDRALYLSTPESLVVNEVPLPTGLSLFFAGIAGLGLVLMKQQAKFRGDAPLLPGKH